MFFYRAEFASLLRTLSPLVAVRFSFSSLHFCRICDSTWQQDSGALRMVTAATISATCMTKLCHHCGLWYFGFAVHSDRPLRPILDADRWRPSTGLSQLWRLSKMPFPGKVPLLDHTAFRRGCDGKSQPPGL